MLFDRAAQMGACCSLLIHGAAVLFLGRLPSTEVSRRSFEKVTSVLPASVSVEITSNSDAEYKRALPQEEVLGQRTSAQNIDSDKRGLGGELTGAVHALRMYPHADEMTLQDSLMNTFALQQTQRINTDRERASLDDRRATPHPAEERTVVSSHGRSAPTRPASDRNAQRGITDRDDQVGRTVIATRGTEAQPETLRDSAKAAQATAPSRGSAPSGIQDSAGQLASPRMHSRFARPDVHEGPAATPRLTQDERVRDRENAELLAAQISPSWVEATRRHASIEGAGRGGMQNNRAPGSGTANVEGGRAVPYSESHGDHAPYSTTDARYLRWFLEQKRRVASALHYPRQRQLAMDQGTSVYRLEVQRNGSLAQAPTLIRSSGFRDLDESAQKAIEQSVPFSPLPDELAPQQPSLHITMAIEFSNPMVH